MNRNNKNRNRWATRCKINWMSDYNRDRLRENKKNVFNSARTKRKNIYFINDDLN